MKWSFKCFIMYCNVVEGLCVLLLGCWLLYMEAFEIEISKVSFCIVDLGTTAATAAYYDINSIS